MGKFIIYTGNYGQHRFTLKARKGEKILQSEGYNSKSGVKNGIESVKHNAVKENRFEQRESSNGKHYFVLKAGNGEIIGTSQMYDSLEAYKNALKAVQRAAADASAGQENKRLISSSKSLDLIFDMSEFDADETSDMLILLSDLYRSVGGDRLIIKRMDIFDFEDEPAYSY